jgi:hypothetical protein
MTEPHEEALSPDGEGGAAPSEPPVADEDQPTVTPAESEDESSVATEGRSLKAATRLVEPGSFNDLTPVEISPRHLLRARREMYRARSGLLGLQRDGLRLIARAHSEAQTGQRIARLAPGRWRARRIRWALRRASELHARYDSLQDERARISRRIAAARDVLDAWNSTSRSPLGQPLATSLNRNILSAARTERVTRDRLDEAERMIHHLDAAEEAMRRDSEALRLDPVTFRRFAGRARWRVRLAILAFLLVLVALLYPPWAPPHVTAACGGSSAACTSLSTSEVLSVFNQGDGVLIGWLTITVEYTAEPTTTQVMPLVLMPRASRMLTCSDLGICSLTPDAIAHVQITSSGGTLTVPIG